MSVSRSCSAEPRQKMKEHVLIIHTHTHTHTHTHSHTHSHNVTKMSWRRYRTLGMNVSFSAPPEKDRKQILNDVWRIVMQLEDPGEYIACAEVWIEYVTPLRSGSI